MGTTFEFNDTLQITEEQGFPKELNPKVHQQNPLNASAFKGRVFKFRKPGRRIFHTPPVRVFLVENRNGKWIYWGLVHVFGVEYDHEHDITKGKFRIIYIYTPEQMKIAHDLIDRNPNTKFIFE